MRNSNPYSHMIVHPDVAPGWAVSRALRSALGLLGPEYAPQQRMRTRDRVRDAGLALVASVGLGAVAAVVSSTAPQHRDPNIAVGAGVFLLACMLTAVLIWCVHGANAAAWDLLDSGQVVGVPAGDRALRAQLAAAQAVLEFAPSQEAKELRLMMWQLATVAGDRATLESWLAQHDLAAGEREQYGQALADACRSQEELSARIDEVVALLQRNTPADARSVQRAAQWDQIRARQELVSDRESVPMP